MRFIYTILLLLLTGPLHAGENTQNAGEAMRAGNYAIAYCIWQPQAEAGDAHAQYNIGWLYHNGYGLAVDDLQAEHWWQQATAQGHIEARFALAALYTHGGKGVARNIGKAIPLYIDSLATNDEEVRLILHNLLLANSKTSRLLASHLEMDDWRRLGTIVMVKNKRANIRRKPGLNSAIVGVLDQGASLLAVTRQGRWVQVVVMQTGISGWIHTSLLSTTSP